MRILKNIVVVSSFVICQCAYAYDFEDYGLYYNIISSSEKTCGLALVEKGIVAQYEGVITIPQTVADNGITYTVTQIQSNAFNQLYELKGVNIPQTVTSIGSRAFSQCTSLVQFNIPAHIETIGDYAFQNCSHLEDVIIEDSQNILNLGLKVFYQTPVKYAYIGRSFTAKQDLYDYAESVIFQDYKSLKSIDFGKEVTSIPEYAFYGCRFSTLSLPDNLTIISDDAFENCWSLESVVLPSNLERIEWAAFRGCSNLTDIKFPQTLKYIGSDGFMDFAGESLDLTETSLSIIESCAFRACNNLKEIKLPESLIEIGPTCFQSSQISTITIPKNVKTIGGFAFNICPNLETVYCLAETPPTTEESTFDQTTYELATLYVPKGTKDLYSKKGAWKYFKTIQEIESASIETINSDNQNPIYFDINGNIVSEPIENRPLKSTNVMNTFIVL